MSGNPHSSDQNADSNSQPPERFWCQTRMQMVNLSFVWTIENFCLIPSTNVFLNSHLFPEEGHGNIKWMLKLYPKGSPGNPGYVSLFLGLVSRERQNVPTSFTMSILDTEGHPQHAMESLSIQEFAPGKARGYGRFVKISELENPNLKLLADNNLIIQCDLRMVVGPSVTSGKCTRFERKRSELNSVPKEIGRMLESQKFSDVVLVGCDGVELPAHKVLLASRSAVFASMFDHQMQENIENRVEIADISSDVLREVLRYIYTGESPNLPEMVNDLLTAADKYALGGLKDLCEDFLSRNLTVDSAAEVYALANMHSGVELRTFVRDFICDHAVEVLEKPGWQNLLVRHPDLANEVFKAIAARTCEPPLKRLRLQPY